MKWTNEQVAAVLEKNAPKNKYNAKRVQVDSIWFDSKVEAHHYQVLKLKLAAGLITNLKVHPTFPIVYKETRLCDVELDFAYDYKGQRIYEDVKGRATNTPISVLKRKLVELFHGISVDVIGL